jgi:hypothetical protein
MSISTDVRDNEAKKFRDTANGPAVAVVLSESLSGAYVTNDLDDVFPITYIGKSNGTDWEVQKVTESGSDLSIRYATISNNLTITNYSDAWDNRLTLTYVAR